MALPATDNFTRADETPLAGNWTGIIWDLNLVTNAVNQAGDSSYCLSGWNADSFNNDQYSECKLTSAYYETGVAVRMSGHDSTGCCYFAAATANWDAIKIYKIINNATTQLGSTISHSVADGDTIKLEVSGTTLTVYHNDELVETRTDSSLSSGSAGLGGWGVSSNQWILDDWEGGNVGATAYTLTAANGSYSETGQAVLLKKASNLLCSVGTFIETGQAAILSKTTPVAPLKGYWPGGYVHGTYYPAGYWPVAEGQEYSLSCSVGAFTETGQASTLKKDSKLSGEKATFTETGQAVILKTDRKLSVDKGTFVETGQPVSFYKGLRLSTDCGVFTEAGQSISFLYNRRLVADYGSFAETGQSVTLKQARLLAANPGSYALSGKAIIFQYGKFLNAATGTYDLTGQSVTFTKAKKLVANTGVYALSGQEATLSYIPTFYGTLKVWTGTAWAPVRAYPIT